MEESMEWTNFLSRENAESRLTGRHRPSKASCLLQLVFFLFFVHCNFSVFCTYTSLRKQTNYVLYYY
jgi:hypothetical protein